MRRKTIVLIVDNVYGINYGRVIKNYKDLGDNFVKFKLKRRIPFVKGEQLTFKIRYETVVAKITKTENKSVYTAVVENFMKEKVNE